MTDPSSVDILGPASKPISNNKDARVASNKLINSNDDNINTDVQHNNNNNNNIINGQSNLNNGNNNSFINNFIMTGNMNSNSGTNLNAMANRRDSSVIYPPTQRSNQRNDPINAMFNNFNLPRFSTDASITPFLNISDANNTNQPQINTTNNNNNNNADHFPHLPDTTKRRSQDLSQIARGYSIVNNNMWTPPTNQHNIPHIANPLQTKVATNHVDPLDVNSAPKFKLLSFSAGKGNNANNAERNRNESLSVPPANRGSTAFVMDNADMDLTQAGGTKRGSLSVNMKPPTILPASNSSGVPTLPPKFQGQNFNRTSSGNGPGNLGNMSNLNPNLGLDNFFNSSNSRKNSLKIGGEDFDFDNRRRNSSIKLLIDPTNQPVNSSLTNPIIQQGTQNGKDIQKTGFPAEPTSLPSSLSRFSSMMNFMGNEQTTQNGLPNGQDGMGTNQNMLVQVPQQNGNYQPNLGTTPPLDDSLLNGKNKKKKPQSKARKTTKKRKQKAVDESNSNGLQNTETKKPRKKVKDKKNDRKSSFEDVLKKITRDHGIDKNAAEQTLLQEGEKKARDLLGVTKIDELMLMIDARKKGVTEKVETTEDGKLVLGLHSDILPPTNEIVGGVEKPVGSRGVKQHECKICHRFFTQLTHLEVHIRSHIGYKPFECQYCKKRFTQGGNLRTHLRLHTGEKPYECEVCSKRFSRKGNLAAHVLTHQKLRPYVCRLDNCYKTFTQLGNMKAHQNRFHLDALSKLTERLAKLDPNEIIAPEERDMLEYFASLYKNSNKGIRGRGRDNSRVGSPVKDKETTIIDDKSLSNRISPEYRLYQTNSTGQQSNPQQSVNSTIGATDNNINGAINIDFSTQVNPVSDPHQQNMGAPPLDSHYLPNDQQNAQLLDENGVDFKFVSYKK
ncbi:hypothetical protein C6P45_000787 [Maudiozyma exigua]|uniref:C2H2-type domain-containing protein n=1 Tax=Maudiozyma exigua TaxID=34358 RepID=A0A9P6WDR5_MAUEX|nr:hypothetical protein C6P45_000787 [Kazachstania exigua]